MRNIIKLKFLMHKLLFDGKYSLDQGGSGPISIMFFTKLQDSISPWKSRDHIYPCILKLDTQGIIQNFDFSLSP